MHVLGSWPFPSWLLRSTAVSVKSFSALTGCKHWGSRWNRNKANLSLYRLDYTKGLISRLKSFQRLLVKYPKWIGKVLLLQVSEDPSITHCYKCLVTPGGRALPHGREGVPGAEGGDRQAGGLHQRPVLHASLVPHQVELETIVIRRFQKI